MDEVITTPINVEAEIKQYTLVGDDIYIKKYTNENIPDWYKALISNIISNDTSITNVEDAITYLNNLSTGYTQSITELQDHNDIIDTNITSLVSKVDTNTSAISNLNITKVTPTEASAISLDTIASYINGGSGAAWFNDKISTYANDIETTASNISTLSTALDGHTASISTLDTLTNTAYTWSANASKLITSPDGSITGWSFGDGTSTKSYFKINATNFQVSDGATGYTPFSIAGNAVAFNGKVTFGNSQIGTIDEAIAASVNTISVGDKNINITDNLIPTTSLLTDSNNAGYQFIGTVTKANTAGIDSFAEPQLTLVSNSEVYSPYVDELYNAYYYRFGIKGTTNLSNVKIVTIDSSDIATYSTLTIVLDNNVTLDTNSWYIIEGIINPVGGNTDASGSIRSADFTKIGSINNFVIPSNTAKLLLGWQNAMIISRMKLAKITADTLTGSYATTDYVSSNTLPSTYNPAIAINNGTTTIDGGKITTGSLDANRITVGSIMTSPIIVGGTINGNTINGGTINGVSITGSVIKASWIDYTSTGSLTNWQQYIPTTVPSQYVANFAHNSSDGSLVVDSQGYVRLPTTIPLYTTAQNNSASASTVSHTYSSGLSVHDDVMSYDFYTSSSTKRCISNSPYLSSYGMLFNASFTDYPGNGSVTFYFGNSLIVFSFNCGAPNCEITKNGTSIYSHTFQSPQSSNGYDYGFSTSASTSIDGIPIVITFFYYAHSIAETSGDGYVYSSQLDNTGFSIQLAAVNSHLSTTFTNSSSFIKYTSISMTCVDAYITASYNCNIPSIQFAN